MISLNPHKLAPKSTAGANLGVGTEVGRHSYV